jgi:drug/metabolite transporter (DMT)-like permease
LLIRLSNLSDFSLIFYRSFLPAITIFLFIFWSYRKETFKVFLLIGVPGIIYATFYAITHICFVYSIQNTSVANTLVIIAGAPIFAAIFSIIFLKEKPSTFTWVIIFVAIISMITIGLGNELPSGLLGDLMALIVAILMGASGVLVRYFKNIDLVPACFVGCLLAGLYSLPFEIEFNLTNAQIIYLSLMCFIMLPIPFMVMTIAPKYTPAYQVYLIFLLESVLGTAWVWIVINEVPSLNTIIGGSSLLFSVLIYMILETRK